MSGDGAFAGFPASGLRLLTELAAHNDRAWFAPRKERYEREVLEPMRAFVAAATRALARAKIPIGGDAKRSIFRVYRDVRFSPDKRPYRTNAACYLSYDGGRGTQGGLYVHVEPGRSFLSVPFYLVPAPMLRRWREAMRRDPRRFARVLGALEKKGLKLQSPDDDEDSLKRLPRGFEDVADTELGAYFSPAFVLRRSRSDARRGHVAGARRDRRPPVRDAKPLLDYGWSLD